MKKFEEEYEKYREKIDQELLQIKVPEELAYFRESLLYPLKGKGKRIRPVLVILSGTSLGVELNQVLPAAVAIEILHTFTLVHDDIMDGDEKRRGLPTVHKKWNVNTGILSGDGLLSISFAKLVEKGYNNTVEITKHFNDTLLKICEGQKRDINFEDRTDITTEEYLEMVGLKTGELLGLSCSLGAMIAQVEESIVNSLYKFGKTLGQAFQIQDDLLELESSEDKMGKSLGSDFAGKKKTYPLVKMLGSVSEEEKKKILTFLTKNSYNRVDILEKFKEYNVIEEGEKLVRRLMDESLNYLTKCPRETEEQMKKIVTKISERDH